MSFWLSYVSFMFLQESDRWCSRSGGFCFSLRRLPPPLSRITRMDSDAWSWWHSEMMRIVNPLLNNWRCTQGSGTGITGVVDPPFRQRVVGHLRTSDSDAQGIRATAIPTVPSFSTLKTALEKCVRIVSLVFEWCSSHNFREGVE